mmetsp:Transcript_16280/g.35412  ORF Transcript_16280/g.35412 Transcript_16280/m.35412 type:complete len:642 (+) Transcript_16280:256-2181(+)
MSATKKYTLYSATGNDDGPKPCAFFASPAGCRNGDKCKFYHGENPPPTATASGGAGRSKAKSAAARILVPECSSEDSDSSSVVSSESEGEVPMAETTPVASSKARSKAPAAADQDDGAKEQTKGKKRKQNAVAGSGVTSGNNPFAARKKTSSSDSAADGNVNPFAEPKAAAAAAAATATATTPAMMASAAKSPKSESTDQGPKKKKTKREKKAAVGVDTPTSTATPAATNTSPAVNSKGASSGPASFLANLSLPVAPFSIPGSKPAVQPEAASSSDDDDSAPQHQPVPATVCSSHQHPPLPLPTSTAEGRKWKDAVIATRSHDRYEASYDFARYKEADPPGVESWIKAKPHGTWCAENPPAIAIDCEMCETKDPVTGVTDAKALCRISIISAINPDEVLLDTLVKPAWPVIDYRTRINGIKAEHLETVQFTLRHAQAFLMALCSEETVITGHALHNDLVALKMEHHVNVDSAFLFKVKDAHNATPSLKDLAMSTLGKTMPDTHDSVNDARTALCCLQSYLEKDGNVEPIVRSFSPRRRRTSGGGNGGDHLLVHRIPRFCKPEHITQMLLAHTFVQPKEVGEIEFGSSTGKVHVYFSSPDHANLAFETLSGDEKPDKTGRAQKRVYLRNGDYVHVRSSTKNK